MWFSMIATVLVGAGALALLLRVAPNLGLIDHPIGGRKDHGVPTPVVGGIGIFCALVAGWIMAGEIVLAQVGMLGAGALLLLAGVLDDLFDLNWKLRILLQVIAAALLCAAGLVVERLGMPGESLPLFLGPVALIFTVFAVVGLINAINMIDGVDGLSGACAVVSLGCFAALAAWTGADSLALSLLLGMLAVLVFLAFNLRLPGLPRARTFLGNSGSAFLGLLLAWSAIALTQDGASAITPALAPWLVALPILDCLVLIYRRLAAGRSPFAADRLHLHHLLMDRGLEVGQVVALAVAIHLSIALAGLALMLMQVPSWLMIVGFLVLLGVYGGAVVALGGSAASARHELEST